MGMTREQLEAAAGTPSVPLPNFIVRQAIKARSSVHDDVPIGTIQSFIVVFDPAAWLDCDGSLYDGYDYPELYSVLGNTYGGKGVVLLKLNGGASDRAFRVPDLNSKVTM